MNRSKNNCGHETRPRGFASVRQCSTARLRAATAFAVGAVIFSGSAELDSRVRQQRGFVSEDSFKKVSVVMVVFDELPVASLMNERGEIDEGLFPNFARLQQDSL